MRPNTTSSGLDYCVQRPSPALAGLVDYFWSLRDAPSHSLECIIPSGTLEIVINLHEDEFRIHKRGDLGSDSEVARFHGAIASGAYRGAFVAETRAHASILGVHFMPGGASAILGLPAGELADTHVELEDLWGRRAEALRERLCATAHAPQRFRILEQALIDGLSDSAGVRAEIRVALSRLNEPDTEVRDVARELEVSHRRFIELFTAHVGMTPKRYSRVLRFQRALKQVTAREMPAWPEVALECGYFDQSHLCHDWAEFTGFAPVDFLRRRNVRVKEHHIALPEPATSNFSKTASASRA